MDHVAGGEPAIPARTRPSPTSGRKGTYAQVTTNNPVDQHVGRRIRERRLFLGLSRAALAQQIGVTAQQYDKYESAKNRLSASRLFDVANCLKVSVSHFFEQMSEEVCNSSPARILVSEPARGTDLPAMTGYEGRQTQELIRNWQELPKHARNRVVDLLRSMVALSAGGDR